MQIKSRQLRIAFVDYVLEPDKPGRTGLSDIVWDMASEMVNQGHDVHVIGSYHTHAFPDSRVVVHNFSTPPMGYRNVVGNVWLLWRALTIIRRLEPNIVHTPEYISTAVFSQFGLNIPLVLSVPGNIFHKLSVPQGSGYEWYFAQILKWAARKSARRCARIVAISQEMKWWWERTGSRPERTVWIPLGVNPNRFHKIFNSRQILGWPEQVPVVLYVGRLSIEKGVLDLVEAVHRVKDDLRRFPGRIIIGGKGNLYTTVQEKIHSYKLEEIIQVTDWINQDKLKIWYSAATVVVFPSHAEAFGRVIPESFSCGTPIIASNIAGAKDHIENGKNGYTYKPGDINALADLLRIVFRNPRHFEELGNESLRYAEKFHWSSIMHRITQEVYFPIIEEQEATL